MRQVLTGSSALDGLDRTLVLDWPPPMDIELWCEQFGLICCCNRSGLGQTRVVLNKYLKERKSKVFVVAKLSPEQFQLCFNGFSSFATNKCQLQSFATIH
jgi:hypothetical protein